MHRGLVFWLTEGQRLALQEELQARMYGEFGDLSDANAVRKLCRVSRKQHAILEL
jgi:hypothetical protein